MFYLIAIPSFIITALLFIVFILFYINYKGTRKNISKEDSFE